MEDGKRTVGDPNNMHGNKETSVFMAIPRNGNYWWQQNVDIFVVDAYETTRKPKRGSPECRAEKS